MTDEQAREKAGGMSSDTKWVIGTVVVLAGLLSAQISGGNASLNTRIDDMNARIDDLNASVNARFGDVNARIDDLQADIRELRAIVIETLTKRTEPAD